MKTAFFIALSLVCLTASAEARTRHTHYRHHRVQHEECYPVDTRYSYMNCGQWVYHETWNHPVSNNETHYAHAGDPRPSAWCGWFMRQIKGVADKAYNLARNWAHYGTSSGGPRVGAIVVWPHHVGEIVSGSCPSGEWMVHSGNDGHAVRTRCRSVAGAIAFRA